MMIDTPILAILYEKKSLKMWKLLYIAQALSEGQCGILTMIDIPILTIFMRKNLLEFGHFYRDVSTFLDFGRGNVSIIDIVQGPAM